jgi:hypothetical protein
MQRTSAGTSWVANADTGEALHELEELDNDLRQWDVEFRTINLRAQREAATSLQDAEGRPNLLQQRFDEVSRQRECTRTPMSAETLLRRLVVL